MTQTIAPATMVGEVQLVVSDLERSVTFYQNALGFRVLDRQEGRAVLGAGSRRLLTLVEQPGAKPAPRTTGLYHFAVLLPDRRSLARLLYHMAETEVRVQGASDHGVSEALYLADPDGNGIELYRDREREEWPLDEAGKMEMGTEELDIDDLVMELQDGLTPWEGLPDGTRIGHVHLRVRNIPEAEAFYTGILGFQLMQRYGSAASFVSAGGYHHHIGMNSWQSAGAPPPPPTATGLRWFELLLPDVTALEAVRARLSAAGITVDAQDEGVLVRDPSGNGILLRVGES